MAKCKRISKKYKMIIKEYLLNEVPKIFGPDDIVNIPEFYLTDEVFQLVYDSWKRDCLLKQIRSDFLDNLYKRARGRYNYQTYSIDPNLLFDENVSQSNYKNGKKHSRCSDLQRSSSLRQMPGLFEELSE